jgi:cytochrome bd-type quinol oxidase subunit 2
MKRLAAILGINILVMLSLLIPANLVAAQADITNGLCAGANLQVGTDCKTGGITDAQAQAKINQIIKTVINLFSLVVGVVSVIMIIIGGLRYITSGGDSTNVTGAKNTILYAIIGLVIVALAQFIVRFVLSKIAEA